MIASTSVSEKSGRMIIVQSDRLSSSALARSQAAWAVIGPRRTTSPASSSSKSVSTSTIQVSDQSVAKSSNAASLSSGVSSATGKMRPM